jgi:hypothetical protein
MSAVWLNFETFAPRTNETFSIELAGSWIDVTLVQAVKLPVRAFPGIRRDPFRLLFKCPKLTILPQNTYSIRNATMGKFDIFIVPVGRDRDGIVYEAVFN